MTELEFIPLKTPEGKMCGHARIAGGYAEVHLRTPLAGRVAVLTATGVTEGPAGGRIAVRGADARVQALVGKYEIVPVCPEQLGGLPTPRVPSERRGERVVTAGGRDVTEAYRRGAEAALALCQQNGCEAAVLKEKSPSCGCGQIYDGTFSRRLIAGDGVTVELFKAHGIVVCGESDVEKL